MRRIICFIVSAMIFFAINVGAEEPITIDVNNVNVTIKGTQAVPGGKVTVQVFLDSADGATLDTLESSEYLNVLVCHDQMQATDKGEYEFSFDIHNVTGEYTVYINQGNDGEVTKKTFSFVNMEQFKDVINEVNKSSSIENTEEILRNNKEVFGLNEERVSDINFTSFSTIIYNYVKQQDKLSNEDRTSVLEIVEKAYLVQQLNEQKISDIYEKKEVNGLEQSSIKEWYNKKFVTELIRLDFTERLSGRNFSNLTEYDNALSEAFMLSVVKNPNGYENIVGVAIGFAEELNIPQNLITDSNCKRVAGQDFKTVLEFVSALQKPPASPGGGSPNKKDVTLVIGKDVQSQEVNKSSHTQEKLNVDIFNDLAGYEWAKEAIVRLGELGVINGKENYKFYPSDTVTREEFVKMLVLAFEIPFVDDEIDFTDVSDKHWCYKYVKAAFSAGLIKGRGDGCFGTGEKISRQDMALMAYNAMKASGKELEDSHTDEFDDDSLIADYAKVAIYTLKEKGVISGTGNNCYEPTAYSNRAAAAKIIYMLISQ